MNGKILKNRSVIHQSFTLPLYSIIMHVIYFNVVFDQLSLQKGQYTVHAKNNTDCLFYRYTATDRNKLKHWHN